VSAFATLFVGHPLRLLLVAGLLAAGTWAVGRSSGGSRRARPLLSAAGLWALVGAWEGLVLVKTPEADLRVDWLRLAPELAA
jgi:hypothetical protein